MQPDLPDSEVRGAWRGMPSYDPTTYPPLPVEHPPLARQIWTEVKTRAFGAVVDVVWVTVMIVIARPIVIAVAARYGSTR